MIFAVLHFYVLLQTVNHVNLLFTISIFNYRNMKLVLINRDSRGHDRMVVGCTAICAYHH